MLVNNTNKNTLINKITKTDGPTSDVNDFMEMGEVAFSIHSASETTSKQP